MSATSRLLHALALASMALGSACGGGAAGGAGSASLELARIRLLNSLGPVVVVPALEAVLAAGRTCEATLDDLAAGVDGTSLDAAQAAWRSLREAWNRAEACLFGPVRQRSLEAFADESLLDIAAIEATLAGVAPIDASLLNSRGVDERGMFVLEYFLFDPAGDGCVLLALGTGGDAPRRLAYLQAAAEDLVVTLQKISRVWDPSGEDFLSAWTTAGGGNSVFAGAREAVDLMINQMLRHLTEIIDQRLGRPLGKTSGGAPQPPGAESQRSANSLRDVHDDLESIHRLWFGRFEEVDAFGVDELTAVVSPVVRQEITNALLRTQASLDAIPETLVQSAATNPGLVQQAFDDARELRTLLLTDLIGALETTIGFNPNDGD